MANIHMELPPKGIVQNNFVRVLVVDPVNLSGTGSVRKQLCEYILSLDIVYRTIAETDSKWNVKLDSAVYEIINKGKGTLTVLSEENLLLLNDSINQSEIAEDCIDYNYHIIGLKDNDNIFYNLRKDYVPESTKVYLNGLRLTRGNYYDYREGTGNLIVMNYPLEEGDLLTVDYKSIKNN